MRLLELDPVWLTFEGRRVGFIFRCPLPARRTEWQTCFVEKFYLFKRRDGSYSNVDTAFEPDSQCGIVHACASDRIRDPGNSCNWQSCNPDHQWTVEGGIENASFETISVNPSLDGSAGGNWHGYITNGEIVGGVEQPQQSTPPVVTPPEGRQSMGETVQHEAGKADVIADGPGSVRQVPEGTGEQETGQPKPADTDKGDGWINGKPATAEEVERSTSSS